MVHPWGAGIVASRDGVGKRAAVPALVLVLVLVPVLRAWKRCCVLDFGLTVVCEDSALTTVLQA